jgi:ATP-binding cassette subfamily F protein 3
VLPFDFPSPERPLSPPIVAMEGASVGYGDTPVLSRLSLVISDDDRIGLLGSNGNGKSTFAKLIGGRLEAMQGQVRRSGKLRVAYFAQHQLDELRPGATPFIHVGELMPDTPEAKIRARCARMGFPGQKADTPVSRLSGGEKARLLMGLATFGGPHLLILDEPTNHLDIDSRAALMEAINDYDGAVILISHDRFLLEACADRLWLVANGTVKPFDDDLDAYRKFVLDGSDPKPRKVEKRPEAEKSADDLRRDAANRRGNLAPLRRRIEAAEAKIAKLEELLSRVDAVLADPVTFRDQPAKAAQLSAQRAELVKGLASAEEEWLALSSEYETAMTT